MRLRERERFDRIFEEVLDALPEEIHALLEECPIVLEDRPSRALLEELGMKEPGAKDLGMSAGADDGADGEDDILCGLHTGIPLTERSVEGPGLGDVIHVFREGVVDMAGGWEEGVDEDGTPYGGEARVREEIRITVLHEIGHHFGLDEDDLERLGYA
ncbi:MAG: hypothetical protein RI967_2201 [Planctomycetota bacterium]